MEAVWWYVILALAVVVVAVTAVVGFLRSRPGRRQPVPPPAARPAPATARPGTEPAGPAHPEAEPAGPTHPEAEQPGDAPAGGTLVEELERPAPSVGRLARLRGRLARSNSAVGHGLLALLSRDHLDEDTWDDVEATLLQADLGVAPTQELVAALRTRARADGVKDPAATKALLREQLLTLVDPSMDRTVTSHRDGGPAVLLIVGVNGTGKTTTAGKLARVLVADGRSVVLGAADTFRAAASQQLQTWGGRVGAAVVTGPEGGDPAAVAYDAVARASADASDAVIIDTAGRLHTKAGLMDELGKVKRVVEKLAPVGEVLLVLDATTGQNGLRQAQVFGEVVDVTGIVLTKLDGTAKGGIVVAVQRELGVPVKLVGLGEGADDLAPFDPEAFVDALLD